ncbi:hypothetical protein OH76DRAFT_1484159 [Lentinus brumalis]|uniref:Leo1-domain-containing protein n=1 Tax=Lentinus brumalis TaxID=2498619 RepID=A0A371D6V1_9APHY|nr:hypothetical protein OH76DRAFT_1484159 [Polyporus brumalis]
MSSLAGALEPKQELHDAPMASPKAEDDIDAIPSHSQPEPTADEDDKHELNDLFGEDEDVNMVEHEAESSALSEPQDQDDRLSTPERRHREHLEYAEDDEPEQNIAEHKLEAEVAIPNIPVPKSSDGNYWVIRMPNFIKVDSKPFHPDTYVGPEHEDEDSHHPESVREKSMSIKLKVENTVRWRWTRDEFGQDSIDTSGAAPRQALGTPGGLTPSQSLSAAPSLSQSVSQSQPTPGASGSTTHAQGLTYLVAQHKRAEILQCEAVVTGYMSLRPTGMQSETHRMLVRAVGQKHSRVARLRMAPDPTFDPEREKIELAKAAARKPRKSRAGAGEDDGFGGTRRRRSGYSRKRTGDDMWSDDDDDDDGPFGRGGSEDEYGDDSADRKKRRQAMDEDRKKGPGEYQTDDFVVADTDEDDDDFGEDSGRRKRKRSAREREDDPEDDLEKLEAKISQNEAQERKRRQRDGDTVPEGGGGAHEDADGGGEDAMDVESEEEDDDFGVRRGRGTAGRKRRAIGIYEDEDD